MKRIPMSVVVFAVMLALASPASAQRVLYLARHAQKDTDPRYDVADARRPLTPLGREQAEALARRLDGAGVTAVYHSAVAREGTSEPIARTYATAEPLIRDLRARGTRLDVQPILYPEALLRDPWDAAALRRYAQDALDQIGREHPNDIVLLVGHENTVPALLQELARRAGRSLPAESTSIAPGEFRLLFTVTPGAADPAGFFRREIYFTAPTLPPPSKTLP